MPLVNIPGSAGVTKAKLEMLDETIRGKSAELARLEEERDHLRTSYRALSGAQPRVLGGPIRVDDSGGCSICIRARALRIRLGDVFASDVNAVEVKLGTEVSMLPPSTVYQLRAGDVAEVSMSGPAISSLGAAPGNWSVRVWRNSKKAWEPLPKKEECDELED